MNDYIQGVHFNSRMGDQQDEVIDMIGKTEPNI